MTREAKAVNKATEALSAALRKFADICEQNNTPLKTVSFRWRPDSGEVSKLSIRYRRPAR